ncbi:hypothetical protein [Alkalihalobacterium elongatum]|uniref:hypothetical protein n=1 Tax=Alkalihalobacterium elongatum TaxID=2675466 RepID=UPI001C1F8B80|nr:hypothetical protein [Alkalihalobacterium elongatum]
MIKKYLILNLITSPLHITICFLLIVGMFMTGEPDDWFTKVNRGLLYLFWFGMIPNLFYFFKHFHTENNLVGFIVSSLLLFGLYWIIVNAAGWAYFRYV